MRWHSLLAPALLLCLAACQRTGAQQLAPLPQVAGSSGEAAARVNGSVGAPGALPPASMAISPGVPISVTGPSVPEGNGDISLDFAEVDIREVVAQILGNLLRVNYTIDPAVHGTATLHTARPLSREQLLPTLQVLLAQSGAALAQSGSLYRVLPSTAASPSLSTGTSAGGSVLLPLRYAGAEAIAKTLQPYLGKSAEITADPAHNTLLVTGDAPTRETVQEVVKSFDIDVLAGQSYAVLPVTSGNAKDFAASLDIALRSQSGGALAGLVRVVPLQRIDAVMVVSSQPRYVEDARRVYALIEQARRRTSRSWHVYYLQDSHADDMAYILQQAFTPNSVTAQPTSATQPSRGAGGIGGGLGGGQMGGGGLGAGGAGQGGGIQGGAIQGAPSGGNGVLGGGAGAGAGPVAQQAAPAAPAAAVNPLLGPLDQSGASTDTDAMRIIPDRQNNGLLVYATQQEADTVESTLHKIDILPLQVRIDATIAEVDLNDQLQYGTQFFFKAGGINGILNNAATGLGNPATTVLDAAFPGFILAGHGAGGAPIAISALQAVTTVNVLSSPEILVLDNHPARLQVGDLVPYLSQTSQSVISAGAPVVNSINYQPTGVIMEVTPRVNSGGLVTMDISQEVSDVDNTASTTNGINSPTFLERSVSSRVVVQDGQTIGLAGLIRDNSSTGNQGIPWLKDVPLLGLLAGTQNNHRDRTELLVLITPHVLHDQRDLRALSDDLREQLPGAAAVPATLRGLAPTGSADPMKTLRRQLHLDP